MHRSLRFQLIAIVVCTVATVLTGSQWLDTTLSARGLEFQLRERGLMALENVAPFSESADPMSLGRRLRRLVRSSHEIRAADVLRLDDDSATVLMTTREAGQAAAARPGADDVRRLRAGKTVSARVADASGEGVWRVAVPVSRDGVVIGAAQADVSLAEVAAFRHWLRTVDLVFLGLSVVVISLLLALFLERRVARPVTALVDGMRRAEAGELGARVQAQGGGEFAFLGVSLNRMLARIEELTTHLSSAVQRATQELADRNRELEEVNAKLSQAQDDIARSERLAALGQLAATIAHELGTPLNSVLGYTQLLRSEALSPEQTERLSIIESQVLRMIETIRSVLDRTRDRPVHRTPVALDELVAEAVALVSARGGTRDLVIRRNVPDGLPRVPADATGLRQVLLNLLANAVDASGPRGTITVSAALVTPNGRESRGIEIAVRDDGQGIPPSDVRRVLEPFYTTKAPGRGTGLGLAIVDHIVRAHGGRVLVDSALGQGTTVRVHLPLEA